MGWKIVFHEVPSVTTIIGVILIVSSLVIMAIDKFYKEKGKLYKAVLVPVQFYGISGSDVREGLSFVGTGLTCCEWMIKHHQTAPNKPTIAHNN